MLVLAGCATSGVPGGGPGDAPSRAASAPAPPPFSLPASSLTADEQILHALNRLGYGPRPGDVERIRRIGLAEYIDAQLHPERIPDEAAERLLRDYPTLTLTTSELLRDYPRLEPRALQRLQSGQMTREEIAQAFPADRRPARIVGELQAAKMARAIWSERQLQEVMVDFWFNHFNVFSQKGAVRWMLTSYERDAIRPHALGRFRDLLVATAREPAMLFYLDNWLSVRPDYVIRQGPNAGRRAGLNENYARELLELHTLGVDGGYTQGDVIEVARCFTGWTIDRPQAVGRFVFRPLAHDDGEKRVLGHVLSAGGGEQDGLRVIDILARHPSTARFIATKLTRRFVGDDPPPALVERAARTFLATDGDVRATLSTIVTSPEFFSVEAYRAKIKTPLELVASAARASGARPAASPAGLAAAGGPATDPVGLAINPAPIQPMAQQQGARVGGSGLAQAVARLGQPLYEQSPPTGYPDVADAWVNTGALVGRMNFALSLAQNRVPGARVDLPGFASGADRRRPDEVLDRLLAGLLQGRASAETRSVLARQLDGGGVARVAAAERVMSDTDVEKVAALVLGSPEFQRR